MNCVLNENMHKVLQIEHHFSGDDIKYREGTITLPEDLVCTSCNIPAKRHNGIRHPLTCRIKLENYKEGDNICVKYREKTISELGLIRV